MSLDAKEIVKIDSQRFGRIEVESSELIRIDGLPGFPDVRHFVLMRHDRESPFFWLVCADEPELGFVVTDPWQFFPDYLPDLEPCHLKSVEADASSDLTLLVIADVAGGELRLNLAAPLLMNPVGPRASQVILERGEHSHRQVVKPRPEPPQSGDRRESR